MDPGFLDGYDEDAKAVVVRESPPDNHPFYYDSAKRRKVKEEDDIGSEEGRCWVWRNSFEAQPPSPRDFPPSHEQAQDSSLPSNWRCPDINGDVPDEESTEDPNGEYYSVPYSTPTDFEIMSEDSSSTTASVNHYSHPIVQALQDTEAESHLGQEFSSLKSFRWAHHQALLRDSGFFYKHLAFPDPDHIEIDVDPYLESLNRASQWQDMSKRAREKRLAFHSSTPPLPGSSCYSPTANGGPLHGLMKSSSRQTYFKPLPLLSQTDVISNWTVDWTGERTLSRPSFRPDQVWEYREISNNCELEDRSAWSCPSFIGAVATSSTSPGINNEIMFFTWKLTDAKSGWHAGARHYAGRRFATDPSRKPQLQQALRCKKEVQIVPIGRVTHTEHLGPMDGVVWLGENEILAFGGRGRPTLRRISVSVSPLGVKSTSTRLVSLPCNSSIREIEKSKDGKLLLVGCDGGTLLTCSIEQLTAGSVPIAKWDMEGSIGSVRWQNESIVTVTNDLMGYAAFDSREYSSCPPSQSLYLDVPTYAHEHIPDTDIVVFGNSEGWLSFYDRRKMDPKKPVLESLRDHSQCVFGDLRYDSITRTLSTFGSPSFSSWYYDQKGGWSHLGNSMMENGLLTADHCISGAPVPHSSLICTTSSTGKIGLVDP